MTRAEAERLLEAIDTTANDLIEAVGTPRTPQGRATFTCMPVRKGYRPVSSAVRVGVHVGWT